MLYDNIAQQSTTISDRLCAEFSQQCHMEQITDRVRALRKRAGLTVRALAAELEMSPSTYAFYEDAKKFKKPIVPMDFAKQLAAVLSSHGVDVADVMELAGVTGELSRLTAPENVDDDEWLEVSGAVAAGVWRAQTEWPAAERYDVRFGPSRYPKAHRFAVRMEGLSMNKTVQPGADLECLWVKFSPTEPRPGDLVIVEQHRHDLVELTCKRLAIVGEEYELRCESYEPEFQDPIPVGKPDENMFTDDEVRVVGIVLSAKLDLAPRDLSERRFRNQ